MKPLQVYVSQAMKQSYVVKKAELGRTHTHVLRTSANVLISQLHVHVHVHMPNFA